MSREGEKGVQIKWCLCLRRKVCVWEGDVCLKARFSREKSLVSSAGRGCSESEGCPWRWCESTSLTYHRAGNRLLYSFKNRGQFSVLGFYHTHRMQWVSFRGRKCEPYMVQTHRYTTHVNQDRVAFFKVFKDKFTKKWIFSRYLLTLRALESCVNFNHPQKSSGASQEKNAWQHSPKQLK